MFKNRIGEADFAAFHYFQVLQDVSARYYASASDLKLCVRIFATDTDFLYLSMLYFAKLGFPFDTLEIDLDKEMVLPARAEGSAPFLFVEWTRVRHLIEDILSDTRFGEGFTPQEKIAHFCAGMFMGGGDYLDRYYGVDHEDFLQAMIVFGRTLLRNPLLVNIENEESLNFNEFSKLIGCSHALSLCGGINGSKKRQNTTLQKKNMEPMYDPTTLEQETLKWITEQVGAFQFHLDIFNFVIKQLSSAPGNNTNTDNSTGPRKKAKTMSDTARRKLPPTEEDLKYSFAQFKYYWRMCNAIGADELPDESDLVSKFEYGLKDEKKGIVYKNVYRKLHNKYAQYLPFIDDEFESKDAQ